MIDTSTRILLAIFMVFSMIVLGMWCVTLMVYTNLYSEVLSLSTMVSLIYVIAFSIYMTKIQNSSEEES